MKFLTLAGQLCIRTPLIKLCYNNTYLSLASGYSVKASQRSSLDKENKSEYPTLLTLAVLRLPVLFPGIFKMLTSPNTAPSARVTWKIYFGRNNIQSFYYRSFSDIRTLTNTVIPSSATTSNFPLFMIYISLPTSPFLQT